MKKVSVVIIWTNEMQKEEALRWIKEQTIYNEIEVVLIDNRQNKMYKSAAAALNNGAQSSQGQVLIFIHQDIYLWEKDIIERYYKYLKSNPTTIAGVAGANNGGTVFTDIYETEKCIHRGAWANGKIMAVDSVDECMFGMQRALWEKLKFDEKCCNDWHCYALEICLHNRCCGGRCCVLPAKICHDSLGNSNQIGFVHTIGNIVRKYKDTPIDKVQSCCIGIKCSMLSYYLYYVKYYVRHILRMFSL